MAGKKKTAQKNNKLIDLDDYRLPNINWGLIIIWVILIYVLIYVIMFFNTSHIERYEVREGSLTVSNVYTGIALREEVFCRLRKSVYL